MAFPPKTKTVTREAIPGAPGWFDAFLEVLNPFLAEVSAALNRQLTRRENLLSGEHEGLRFTVSADGSEPAKVKWNTVTRPRHVWVTKLQREDGAPLNAVWSISWELNQEGQILILFGGLNSGDSYVFSVIYE